MFKELFWRRWAQPESAFLGHHVTSPDGFEITCPPLLTPLEIDALKKYNSSRGVLLQTWALKAAADGYEKLGVSRCGGSTVLRTTVTLRLSVVSARIHVRLVSAVRPSGWSWLRCACWVSAQRTNYIITMCATSFAL